MRVLAVTAMFPSERDPARGAFVASQLGSLEAVGVSVDVVVLPPGRGATGYVMAARRIADRVRDTRPDLVHAHYGLTGWSAQWQETPLVTSFCGDDLLGTPNGHGGITPKSWVGIVMSQHAAVASTGIVCKSEQLRQRLWSRRARQRAVVIPNGVDTQRFSPGDRLEARARLGWDAGTIPVLFPSTPSEPRKRLALAEAAATILRERGWPVRLVVASGVAHELMPVYYRAAAATILTSEWEGSPNVVKESIAAGTPVVTTDVGDVRRWITPGSGRIVPGDPGPIADALQTMLEKLPVADPSRVRDALGLEAVARSLVAYYDEVLTRTRKR